MNLVWWNTILEYLYFRSILKFMDSSNISMKQTNEVGVKEPKTFLIKFSFALVIIQDSLLPPAYFASSPFWKEGV